MAKTGSDNKRNQKYEVILNDEQIFFESITFHG